MNMVFGVKLLTSLLCAGLLVVPASEASAKNRNKKSIDILFESDTHGAVDGYGKLAALYDSMTEADTSYVGLVSVGDFVYGGKTDGLAGAKDIVSRMNAMHYDAVEPGNHEFDVEIPKLLDVLSQLKAPVTCVNLTDMDGNRLFNQYVIKKYGKKKIAYVGVLTTMTMRIERAAFYGADGAQTYNVQGDSLLIADVQTAVDAARADGADYVILLCHIGERDRFNSAKVVAATNGIDAVFDSHSHSVVNCNMLPNKDGKQIPLAQTGQKFANIGKLTIASDGHLSIGLIPVE